MLTNGEIYTAYIEAANQTLRPQDERIALAFAHAIESAVIAKLAAGVSVEPVAWMSPEILDAIDSHPEGHTVLCGRQTQQRTVPLYPAEAIAAARVQENERCSKFLDASADRQEAAWKDHLAHSSGSAATSLHSIPRGYAREIRALIGKEST